MLPLADIGVLFKSGSDDEQLYRRFQELVRVRQVVGPPWIDGPEVLASRDLALSAIVLIRLEMVEAGLVHWTVRMQSVQDRTREVFLSRIRRHVLRDFGGNWPTEYPSMASLLKRVWMDRCLLAFVLAADRHRKELPLVFRPPELTDREGLILLSMVLSLTRDQLSDPPSA